MKIHDFRHLKFENCFVCMEHFNKMLIFFNLLIEMLINMEQTEEEKIPDVKKDLNLQVKKGNDFLSPQNK